MGNNNDVLISAERHIIILGQHGNIQASLARLLGELEGGNTGIAIQHAHTIQDELKFLGEVYPNRDGQTNSVPFKREISPSVPPGYDASKHAKEIKCKLALKDMRVLIEAASASYVHDGLIDCHLKVMLDEAWSRAADGAGLEFIDDLPF